MNTQISNSVRAAKQRLLEQNRQQTNDPDSINPPAKRIVLAGAERGALEAYSYARGIYLAGMHLEA